MRCDICQLNSQQQQSYDLFFGEFADLHWALLGILTFLILDVIICSFS